MQLFMELWTLVSLIFVNTTFSNPTHFSVPLLPCGCGCTAACAPSISLRGVVVSPLPSIPEHDVRRGCRTRFRLRPLCKILVLSGRRRNLAAASALRSESTLVTSLIERAIRRVLSAERRLFSASLLLGSSWIPYHIVARICVTRPIQSSEHN